MDTFEWEDGMVVERPYVLINGQKYYVQEGSISGGTPATANNLNEMQNILNQNILDEFNRRAKIIWTNPNPTNNFNAQTITLDESLDNYDSYEILGLQSTTNPRIVSTGRIPVGHGTFVMQGAVRRPTGTTVSGNTITFEDNRTIISPNDIDNTQMIPMYVIGHNTGLF